MPRHRDAAGRRVVVWLAWVALAGACGSGAHRPEVAASLVQGPTHWLMLPDEEDVARRLRGVPEALAFEERFWKRRDPDPATPGNELLPLFNQRVDAADRLYQEGALRGSLTDRGRALVILGAPPILRYSQRQIPTWEAGHSGGTPNVQTRTLQIETWVYNVPELPEALAAAFGREGYGETVEISFAVEPDRSYITSGERILELAVRAAARQ